MLYVFHVDTGTMMTFQMSLAIESVSNLKEYVERVCKIPADKQVLLINGGECLDPNSRVCSYSAGTDTNPIFLFSKSIIESQTPPSASVDYGSEFGKKDSPCVKGSCCYASCNDFTEKVREAQDMPSTFSTVENRAKLAQQFYEVAKEQTKVCKNLVFDQHLQQQGWAAVVANLEDITSEFKKRVEKFEKIFKEHIKEHDSYLEFLKLFHKDLKILEEIPVLPTLLENNDEYSETEKEQAESAENKVEKVESCDTIKKKISLYDWISSADNGSSIDQLFDHCQRGLEQVNETVFKKLHEEIESVVENAERTEMKDIKGLSERLYGLEQLLLGAENYVKHQSDSAQSFQQNQTRYGNVKDPTILPDLCDFHKNQLKLMLTNHTQICDIRRRCMKAKEELSVNLYIRLNWVMYVENKIQETDQKLVIYHENLKRLRRHLDIIQQIHLAPATYLSAIAEVVRRRAFSQAFLLWASELACNLLTIHNDEVTRRKEFQTQFEGHFLNALFPGMSDLPPSFATQAPSIFDISLPHITVDDIEQLKKDIPDLTENLTVPELCNVNLFMVKSLVKNELDKVDDRDVEEKLVQFVSEVGLASNLDENLLKPTESETCVAVPSLPQIKDTDRGCESETDTEDFEKLYQSPLDLNFEKEILSPRPGTQDASTLTEVGERNPAPPKKPPRTFQKSNTLPPVYNDNINIGNISMYNVSLHSQRTLSISGSQSNTESFTNIKNPSLESIDELSSLRNFTSNTESCFNSHHQQITNQTNNVLRAKSLSPHTPQSPKDLHIEQSPNSPLGHQPNEFITDEYYIDESLPSSLSIETGQSQGEFVRQLDTANNVVALLQDNLETSRTEHDRLKMLLSKVTELTKQTVLQLRNELDTFKKFYVLERINVESICESLNNSFEILATENDNKEREIIQRLTVDHELEISDYRRIVASKNENIRLLNDNFNHIENKYKKALDEVENLKSYIERVEEEKINQIENHNKQINDIKLERDRCIKETTERLVRDHKINMDSLRAKFKLMTSPTEADKGDIEALKQKYELDKKMIVTTEAEKWQKILDEKIKSIEIEFNTERDTIITDVARRISEEKDKQIELLREREANLCLEITKHKNTIQQLVECDSESQNNNDLIERIDKLEQEKCQLEAELSVERSRRLNSQDMSASVAVYEGKVDAATSPKRHRDKLTRSQTTLVKTGKLSLDTCNKGDNVLIIWDKEHAKYLILQESVHLFFLHSDCLEMLGLKDPITEGHKMYCTGEVYDKEYCHAKRAENRYNVPKGTKFYRVKVKPITTPLTSSQNTSSSQSQITMSQSQMTSSVHHEILPIKTEECLSLPNTPTKPEIEFDENKEDESQQNIDVMSESTSENNRLFH